MTDFQVHQKKTTKQWIYKNQGKSGHFIPAAPVVLTRFSRTLPVKVSSELSKETFLEHSHSIPAIINSGNEKTLSRKK
jgi:hypothetical protein